jgi:hypothetical protein
MTTAAPMPSLAPSGDDNDLTALAHRVERLTVSRTNPESFFVEKSEIAHALRRLARTPHQPRRDRDIGAHQGRTPFDGTGERGKDNATSIDRSSL